MLCNGPRSGKITAYFSNCGLLRSRCGSRRIDEMKIEKSTARLVFSLNRWIIKIQRYYLLTRRRQSRGTLFFDKLGAAWRFLREMK